MHNNLRQKSPFSKSASKRGDSDVAVLAAASRYRRPKTTHSNWAWAPDRPEVRRQ
jgi:hypothetical protein